MKTRPHQMLTAPPHRHQAHPQTLFSTLFRIHHTTCTPHVPPRNFPGAWKPMVFDDHSTAAAIQVRYTLR